MKQLLVALLMACLLVVSAVEVPEIVLASTTAQNVAEGFGEIFSKSGTTDFAKALGTTLGRVAPFLSAFGYGLSLFISFIPTGDSAELTYMKEQFGIITEKLEEIEQSLDELSNAVDWTSYQTNFGQLESKIRSIYQGLMEVESYPNWTTAATHWHTQSGDDIDSGTQFYQGITSDSIFTDKLFMAAARLALENDRTETQRFMLRCNALLIMASTIDVAYLVIDAKLDGREVQNLEAKRDIWKTRMEEVRVESVAADQYTVDQANSQLSVDVDAALTLMGGQLKQTFFNYLSDKMNEKYFWRDVFVMVYNPQSGNNQKYVGCQSIQQCYHKFNTYSKNVIVIMEDKTYPVRVNSCSFPDFEDYVGDWEFGLDYYNAAEVYAELPTCTGVTKMVFRKSANVVVYNGNRDNTPLRRADWKHYSEVIAFYFG